MYNIWEIEIKCIGLLKISGELIEQLKEYKQLSTSKPESGGVLVGSFLNSGGFMIINKFTPPQTNDKQSRYLFYRSKQHNKVVKKIWEKSNHISTYVGLWHTHAESIPNYSSQDKKDWNDALNQSEYEGNILFFFIVGQTHIRCWIGTKKMFRNKIELIGELNVQ
jgi:integrative and conjugative element protein (TIGR02256 family)